MSDLEAPPDELRELFAAEKTRPALDGATRAAVRARVAAAVGNTALGAASLGAIVKSLVTLALVVAAGASAFAIVKHARSKDAPARVAAVAPVAVAAPAPGVVEPAAVPAASVHAEPASPPPVPPAKSRVPAQTELLREAWQSLSSGDAERARALAQQDSRLHPDGVLAEERDAVEVLALAQLHRVDEARAANARFLQRYPTSVHRARIQTAIEEMP